MLLIRKAPRLDGPYDDEPGARPRAAIHGNLALAFPQSTTAAMPLRLVPPAGGVDSAPDEVVAPAEPLPDPRRLVGPLVQAIAEVLTGTRPAQQLSEIATLEVLSMLERSAGLLTPRDTGRLRPRDAAALQRPRVSALRLCEPRRGVLEVAAVINTGDRSRAMALRLQVGRQSALYNAEHGPLRWRCTVVRVG
ncbi:MAG TPA: Rv3235 family protein [Mycobacteriales bacterium]|jgi:hypothetical protein|nr:Rv3235 family protein [Mycobacteriales bacterium]